MSGVSVVLTREEGTKLRSLLGMSQSSVLTRTGLRSVLEKLNEHTDRGDFDLVFGLKDGRKRFEVK